MPIGKTFISLIKYLSRQPYEHKLQASFGTLIELIWLFSTISLMFVVYSFIINLFINSKSIFLINISSIIELYKIFDFLYLKFISF